MERALRRILPAVTAAATLRIHEHCRVQSDQQPTHAELAQHWAEAAIEARLKGTKTSLQLTADQEKDWGSFESAVKDAETARFIALQKEQSSGLTPMDRLNAKAERLAESQAGPTQPCASRGPRDSCARSGLGKMTVGQTNTAPGKQSQTDGGKLTDHLRRPLQPTFCTPVSRVRCSLIMPLASFATLVSSRLSWTLR